MHPKILFLLSVCLLMGLYPSANPPAAATPDADPKALPKAVFDETRVTFPPVIAGAVVTHGFAVQNTGDGVLSIPGIYTQ